MDQRYTVWPFLLFAHRVIDLETHEGCWILATHESAQIATEYLWVWIAALSMLIFYPVMFLLMRGWIGQNQVAETVQVEMDAFGQPVLVEVEPTEAEKTKKVAQKML